MLFAMDYGPQGQLYVSRGTRWTSFSREGRTMCCYPLDGHGWATLKAAASGGKHLYIGNYFSGRLVKLELGSAEHVAVADTGVPRLLAGIAEYVDDGADRRGDATKKPSSWAGR